MIEAYGGKMTTDGAIHNFAVRADMPDEAIQLARQIAQGQRYSRFGIIEISDEIDADEAGIIAENNGYTQDHYETECC